MHIPVVKNKGVSIPIFMRERVSIIAFSHDKHFNF